MLIGLHAPDDAAVVRVPPGKAMVHTVDFFRAFIDDPYIFGKVAANHALGDIYAMGAEAQSATAIVTVPAGLEAKQEDLLFQMMSGAIEVLNEANCALVGGHTGEGRELALGFAVNGLVDEDMASVMRKSGMRPGDVLILTKPIGTGTLFAAHAQLKARGRWIDAALVSMCQSNRLGAQCLREHGATACTDLTGFGLLGHLLEMTRPSGVDAELDLSALPVLEGAEETSAAGILSSLQPANVRLRRALRNQQAALSHPRYALIFDPQTAGGLLASIPQERAGACLEALRALGLRAGSSHRPGAAAGRCAGAYRTQAGLACRLGSDSAGAKAAEHIGALGLVEIAPGRAQQSRRRGETAAAQHAMFFGEPGRRVFLVRIGGKSRIGAKAAGGPFPYPPAAEAIGARSRRHTPIPPRSAAAARPRRNRLRPRASSRASPAPAPRAAASDRSAAPTSHPRRAASSADGPAPGARAVPSRHRSRISRRA